MRKTLRPKTQEVQIWESKVRIGDLKSHGVDIRRQTVKQLTKYTILAILKPRLLFRIAALSCSVCRYCACFSVEFQMNLAEKSIRVKTTHLKGKKVSWSLNLLHGWIFTFSRYLSVSHHEKNWFTLSKYRYIGYIIFLVKCGYILLRL